MLVQCKQTKRILNMFWIEVAAFTVPEAERVLKRYTKGDDEYYKAVDSDDMLNIRFRVVATDRHHRKIVSKLLGYIEKYED